MSEKVPPERRRAIVVLSADDYRAVLRDPERVDLTDDPETQLVSFPPNASDQELAELLSSQDLMRPGTLAIQSPYDADRYVSAEAAMADFAIEKFLILARLAKLLGAKRVSFEDVRADAAKSSTRVQGSAKTLASSSELSGSRSLEAKVRQSLRGEHVFPGADPDLTAARRLLDATRLAGDPQLVSLIELRTGSNAIERQEIQFNGTRESAGNIAAALRVAGGPGRLKLAGFSADLARQWQSKVQIEVSSLIEF